MKPLPPRWTRNLPWLLYALLAWASLYPQSRHPQDSVSYIGDALESVYIVAWNVHQFFSDPGHLFDANVLFPLPHALAFTDHRLLPSLLVAPVVWLTGNPILAYNVAVGLALLLAAGAARHVALALGADARAAWAAGALYGFHTYQMHEVARLNIIFHGFLPLALLELALFLKSGKARHAWKLGAWMLLQGLSANYHLLYGSLLIALVLAGFGLFHPSRLLRRLPLLLASGGAALLLFLPLALPYWQLARTYGHGRDLPQSMGLEHYLSTLPGNVVYGAMGPEVRAQQRGPHFIGFVPAALSALALGVWAFGRSKDGPARLDARVWVPSLGVLAMILVLLSLGRNIVWWGSYLGPGPYRLLYNYVPGFQLVRIPERLGLLAMLCVALLASRGLTLVRRAGHAGLALLLTIVIPLEHLSPRLDVARLPVGRAVPAVYRWLSQQPVRALAEVPIRGEGLVRHETAEMYYSTYHFRPIIHGYTAYPPQLTRLLRRLASQFPAEVCLQAFQKVGVDTVVVHRDRDGGTDLLQQLSTSREDPRFRRLASLAGLDPFEQLDSARAAGRIARIARFEPAIEVYRVLPAAAHAPAPFPGGHRERGPSWVYRASSNQGDVARLADADLTTVWLEPQPLRGDEFVEVSFGRPIAVTGLVLPLTWSSVLPTRFRVEGQQGDGAWQPLARFGEAQALQLLDQLLNRPSRPALGFDLHGQLVSGLRVSVEEGGTSFDGWSLPELEVWVPGPAPQAR